MKIIERFARKVEHLKEDPQDWAEFVTDCLCIVGVAFLAAFALVLIWGGV
jgi:hypothetical protein